MNWHGSGVVLALALIGPAVAHAQDATLVRDLAPEIAKGCEPSPYGQSLDAGFGVGAISGARLGKALWDAKRLPAGMDHAWVAPAAPQIAEAAFNHQRPNDGASNTLELLKALAQTWSDPSAPVGQALLPLASGGVLVQRSDGRSIGPGEAQAVLVAMIGGAGSEYRFLCRLTDAQVTAPPARPTGQVDERGDDATGPVIGVTGKPEDLAVSELSKKSFAELSYLDDQAANAQTYSATATLGLMWPDRLYANRRWRDEHAGWAIRAAPGLFLQYERKGSDTTADADETNNLNLGLQASGFLQTRNSVTRSHYFVLNSRFLSDDNLDSRAWSVTARVIPGLRLTGFDLPQPFSRDRAEFRWLVTGVADYEAVDDPGDKVKWATKPEFARIGLDAEAEFRFFLDEGQKQAFSVNVSYGLREALSGSDGDADLWTAKLLFEPTPNYAFGLVYREGSNLDSLEAIDQWTLTIGVRR